MTKTMKLSQNIQYLYHSFVSIALFYVNHSDSVDRAALQEEKRKSLEVT